MSTTPSFRKFFRYWLRLGFIPFEVAMGRVWQEPVLRPQGHTGAWTLGG